MAATTSTSVITTAMITAMALTATQTDSGGSYDD